MQRDAEGQTAESIATGCDFDPNSAMGAGGPLIGNAARGDLDSLRAMLGVSLASLGAALCNREQDRTVTLVIAAETALLARLCASHRLQEDARRLAGVLCINSDLARIDGREEAADRILGESVAILECLAAEGDDLAAVSSGVLVTGRPSAVGIAKDILREAQA